MGLDMYVYRNDKEVAYWRKANQIRGWFARHASIENCESTPLTKEMLIELVDDCKAVINNHSLARFILPTTDGFFFGSQAYDDWYYHDLTQTVSMLEPIINETDWDNDDVSYFEWW